MRLVYRVWRRGRAGDRGCTSRSWISRKTMAYIARHLDLECDPVVTNRESLLAGILAKPFDIAA